MDNKQRLYSNLPGMDKGIADSIGIIILILFLCLTIVSCGTGTGSNAGTGTNSQEYSLFSAELPRCSSPPSNSVYLCRNISKSTEDTIAIDVHLNSDAPVFGAAFDLLLDQSSVEVARKEDQSVDFSPPDPAQAGAHLWKHLFVAINEGTLIIGASRGRELGPLTGDIPVVTLKFKKPTGESQLTFSNNSIIAETGLPIKIPEERWFGGYFTPEQ